MTRRPPVALLCCALAVAAGDIVWPCDADAQDSKGSEDGGQGRDGGGRGGDGSGGRADGGASGRGGDGSGAGSRAGGEGGAGARAGGDEGGRGDPGGGRAQGRGPESSAAGHGWRTTSPEGAREAVARGWALPLNAVLPTVSDAAPGQILEVDLRQTWSGAWQYEFLVLTKDRRYQEVVVDAQRNQVIEIRKR